MEITPHPHFSATYAESRVWRGLAAVAIVLNIALNYVSQQYPFNGQTNAVVSGKYPTLLTPAGYAFSIWGLIFLSLLAYAVWQLLPAQRHNPLPSAVARPLVVANLATGAWLVVFAYELMPLSAAVMLIILGSLIVAYGRARRLVLEDQSPAIGSVPVALYLGWISVATVINLTIALRDLGWQPELNVSLLLALVLIAIVTALGILVGSAFRDVVIPLVVAWALVAIWLARRPQYPELAWAALAGAVLAGVVGVALALRRRRVVAGV
ncbi:tryptophan-rich sensory protein [Hymenobacter sp. DG25B]|uniref:tryptophan-rich sensory protein n=1 Tax=Hymenobacter sp. DG25B TaxID=1385664 RepID=UPI0006627A52|nr:tryptophan-rich sensory protein [Hymenobacter sp. DG25B]